MGAETDFCGYSDAACQAKIKDSIESSMSTIGTMGAIFIVFFLVIMFLTLQGIKIYNGGDDDDSTERKEGNRKEESQNEGSQHLHKRRLRQLRQGKKSLDFPEACFLGGKSACGNCDRPPKARNSIRHPWIGPWTG